MIDRLEHNFGCMTVTLIPVCATGVAEIPNGALCTVMGTPIVTSDGYYLVVKPINS